MIPPFSLPDKVVLLEPTSGTLSGFCPGGISLGVHFVQGGIPPWSLLDKVVHLEPRSGTLSGPGFLWISFGVHFVQGWPAARTPLDKVDSKVTPREGVNQ